MFRDAGVHPLLACLGLMLLYLGFSVSLFDKMPYAEYAYMTSALAFVSKLSDTKRNEFLKLCFGNAQLRKVRIVENILVSLPFFVFLLYKQMFLTGTMLLTAALILAVLNFKTTLGFVLWTPFSRWPFEFVEGFRNSYYLILILYIVASIAVPAENFNLCVFAMLLVFVVILSYYSSQEKEYFVWVYNLDAKHFLFSKIKTALLLSFFLTFPIAFLAAFSFPQYIGILLLLYLLGWAFLIYMIVSKYAIYPTELNIVHGILFFLCVSFPFLLIFLIPYFFNRSRSRLTFLLK